MTGDHDHDDTEVHRAKLSIDLDLYGRADRYALARELTRAAAAAPAPVAAVWSTHNAPPGCAPGGALVKFACQRSSRGPSSLSSRVYRSSLEPVFTS